MADVLQHPGRQSVVRCTEERIDLVLRVASLEVAVLTQTQVEVLDQLLCLVVTRSRRVSHPHNSGLQSRKQSFSLKVTNFLKSMMAYVVTNLTWRSYLDT